MFNLRVMNFGFDERRLVWENESSTTNPFIISIFGCVSTAKIVKLKYMLVLTPENMRAYIYIYIYDTFIP